MEASIAHNYVRNRAATRPIEQRGVDDFTPTVFIVDDDISVREALEALITDEGWESKSFASAEEFLAHRRSALPCCLVLDLALPGLSGLELQKQLTGRPDMPIIFMTGQADVATTVEAMKAGAVEFLTKPSNDVVLLRAIRMAIERSRAALRHDWQMQMLARCYSTLSPREREVLALVASGLPNKLVGASSVSGRPP